MSWFDMKEANRMHAVYIKALESNRYILNMRRLAGKDTSEAEANVKLYEGLLEDAEKRIETINKESGDE